MLDNDLERVTVTQVKHGMWLVNFPEFKLDKGKSHWVLFQLNQIRYTMGFSVNETGASMKLTDGKIIFSYYFIL